MNRYIATMLLTALALAQAPAPAPKPEARLLTIQLQDFKTYLEIRPSCSVQLKYDGKTVTWTQQDLKSKPEIKALLDIMVMTFWGSSYDKPAPYATLEEFCEYAKGHFGQR